MTASDLARIAEAIDADQRQTDVSNWPLSRERTRAYLALARAVQAEQCTLQKLTDAAIAGGGHYDLHCAYEDSRAAVDTALAALTPAEVPDAAE